LTKDLKEIITDVSFISRLRDEVGKAEVMMFLEHKSKPSKNVPLQMLTQGAVTLYCDYAAAGYSDSYQIPIPLMVLVYNGKETWDGNITFQGILPNLPKIWKHLVVEFEVAVINLNLYDYGHLPGKPATQAIVESMKRATDGTFLSHLPNIVGLVREANFKMEQSVDLLTMIGRYCSLVFKNTSSKHIFQSISNTFTGKEGIEMATAVEKGIWEEATEQGFARGIAQGREQGIAQGREQGIEQGREEGREQGQINSLLRILTKRFGLVNATLNEKIHAIKDNERLAQLIDFSLDCKSLEEFEKELK
jgi:hypothetical protein